MNPNANLFLPSIIDGFDDYRTVETNHVTVCYYVHSFVTDTRTVANQQPFLGLFFNHLEAFEYIINFGKQRRTYRMKLDDFNLLYVPPQATVTFSIEKGTLSATVITFPLTYLQRYQKQIPLLQEFIHHVEKQVPARLSNKNFTVFAEIMDTLAAIFAKPKKKDIRATTKAKILGHVAVRAALKQIASGNNPFKLRYDPMAMFDVKHFLEKHLEQPFSMAFLAATCGLSKGKLRLGIEEMWGTTLTGLVARLRVKKAKAMLRDTKLTVSEIAKSVGCSQGGFYRIFKRESGYTPISFRTADVVKLLPRTARKTRFKGYLKGLR